jgi:TRAP-type C4-dicarboxylate transport system permease large subunit
MGILIPPSITMIVYGISTETSIGRLFLAGVVPGAMLTGMFMVWALVDCKRKGFDLAAGGVRHSLRERLVVLPCALPFAIVIPGVLFVLGGSSPHPSGSTSSSSRPSRPTSPPGRCCGARCPTCW